MASINANTGNTKTQSAICIMLFLRDMHALMKFNKILHIVCVLFISLFQRMRLRTTYLINKKFLFRKKEGKIGIKFGHLFRKINGDSLTKSYD